MGDGSKYSEGNYSMPNPFKTVGEWTEDLKQACEFIKKLEREI